MRETRCFLQSNLACLDGWDEIGGTTEENCQRWMEGHTHGTLHDFGIGGCLNPFGGQICRCGAASSCGVYQDFLFNWVDISDTGERITSWDDGSNADDGWKHIDLGFSFPWYGTVQTTITVGTNGVITFGDGRECLPKVSTSPSRACPLADAWLGECVQSYPTVGASRCRLAPTAPRYAGETKLVEQVV